MDPDARLASLRHKIDALDTEMHQALMRRGTLIAELIAAKAANEPGRVFKPGREAVMMRAIQARHEGAIPLSSVEHIWREIIATFTQLQAPFTVIVAHGDRPEVRDAARFAFGFSSPLETAETAASAIARLGDMANALAYLPLSIDPEAAWWSALDASVPTAPRIIARVPAFTPPDHMADVTGLIVGTGQADGDQLNQRAVVVDADGAASDASVEAAMVEAGATLLARSGASYLAGIASDALPSLEDGLKATAPKVRVRLAGHYASPLANA